MAELKPCLFIAPIGEAGSETRARSDQVLEHIIRPAAKDCGYHATRGDEMKNPGLITNHIIQRIANDPLVIADLAEHNPNVFYELAIRHALRKPFVQLYKKGEQLPFDIAGVRAIEVNHRDLDSAAEAKRQISESIQYMEANPGNIETPISSVIDRLELRSSDNAEKRVLDLLAAGVTDMARRLEAVAATLENPRALFPPHYVEQIMRQLESARAFPLGILYELRDRCDLLLTSTTDGELTENLDRLKELIVPLRQHIEVVLRGR